MKNKNLKIRIITIHGIPNFGSVFQTMALCRYLQQVGYEDVKVIDYNPAYFKPHSLRSIAGVLLNMRDCRLRDKKYKEFLKANVPLTDESFTTYQELESAQFDADVYIAGGDQLWNVYHDCGRDDAYKLAFVNGNKVSYGTSMGQSDFSDAELDELASKVKDFSAVSVRESSSVKMLASRDILAKHVADPVFLLNKEDYERVIVEPEDKHYLLVYMVTPSKLLEDCIAHLSRAHNLKVVLCFGLTKKCTCDKHDKSAGPAEILGYIKNADYILSASFHATAFATMFQKQFFTLLPGVHTNERIVDFLRMRNLENRIITEGVNLNEALNDYIDYSIGDSYEDFITSSKIYLNNSLNRF